jgi:hypothetical protein
MSTRQHRQFDPAWILRKFRPLRRNDVEPLGPEVGLAELDELGREPGGLEQGDALDLEQP